MKTLKNLAASAPTGKIYQHQKIKNGRVAGIEPTGNMQFRLARHTTAEQIGPSPPRRAIIDFHYGDGSID